jgi:hypothetical protein
MKTHIYVVHPTHTGYLFARSDAFFAEGDR